MRSKAEDIVNKLLEYGSEEYAQRPGGPQDPWRQSLGHVQPLDYAPRPGSLEPDSEVLPAKEHPLDIIDEPPVEVPIRPKVNPRFKWLPPTSPGP